MKNKRVKTLMTLMTLVMLAHSHSVFAGVTLSIINDIADNVKEFSASGFRTTALWDHSRVFLNPNAHGRVMHHYHWSPKTTSFMVGFKSPVTQIQNQCPLIDYCGHSGATDLGDVNYVCASSFWRVEHNTTVHVKLNKDYVLSCEREISTFDAW